jgi:two-component system, cell cycle response regulator DivK
MIGAGKTTRDMPTETAGASILVVDDAPVNLKLMRLLLTHERYVVRTAGCAEDALRMVAEFRPDLVLADIRLPGMDGLEMTRRIKANPQTRDLRVAALTACAMEGDRERALDAGCEDFISKPIDSASLASRIRELLARRPAKQFVSPEPPLLPAPDFGLSGPEMEGLRRRFAESGARVSRQIVESLGPSFDPVQAGLHLHQWSGSAALLGFPAISLLARQAEQLLRDEQCDTPAFRASLSELAAAFAEARQGNAIPLPSHLAEALSHKRIALIGFEPGEAHRMCALLERVTARPLVFEASDDPRSETVRSCAAVVVQVNAETLASTWLNPGESPSNDGNLVLTGSRRDLLGLSPAVRLLAREFLVDDWEPEEALMRLAAARQRSASLPAPAPPAPIWPKPSIPRPNVVIADDDSVVLTLVGATLENYGMTCLPVDNGPDALRAIREEKPHLAVLDVNMPGLDGFEVLSAVRAEELPTMVVLLTARQQEKEIVRGFELGADDYLTKPFNPYELAARLKRLLRR